jgi:hypothetical protein
MMSPNPSPSRSITRTVPPPPPDTAHVVWEWGCVGSLLGLVVGPLSAVLVALNSPFRFPSPVYVGIAFSIGGLIASAFQCAFLRPAIPPSPLWLIVSTLMWATIGVGLDGLLTAHVVVSFVCAGTLANGLVSIGQYLLIRRYIPSAWQWIVMNTLLGAFLGGGPVLLVGVLR